MIRKFLNDVGGNFAMMTAIAIVPIMGGLALAVDYSEMSRQRQGTLHALDAAGMATAWRYLQGGTDAQLKQYAKEFFEANLGGVEPKNTILTVTLPNSKEGGSTLKLSAALKYKPYFLPAFLALLGKSGGAGTNMDFSAQSEIRLKNTMEVALVLDNSGSMSEVSAGAGQVRFNILKAAAKQLVDTIAAEAAKMKQVQKPVQFSLVPFAASVNVGPQYATASWMDVDGISPIHHENFNWPAFTSANKKVQKIGEMFYKKGTDWGTQNNQKMTRFTLFDDMQRITGTHQEQTGTEKKCDSKGKNCKDEPIYTTVTDYSSFASWQGCVEVRPFPHGNSDTAATTADPGSLFVPMFAPDETDNTDSSSRPANNNWWKDFKVDTSTSAAVNLAKMKDPQKYYTPALTGTNPMGLNQGPNASCSTKPITPLTDVSNVAGQTSIKKAIDDMTALGATNVPEGMAWGWRTVSSKAPFTEGRNDSEKGNDKVVIVLTDGANTYYTPETVIAQTYSGTYYNYGGNDLAGMKALYSNYGYTNVKYMAGNTRLYQNTSSAVSKTTFTNANYSKAMNEQFAMLCDNAKTAGVIVMTVALDLDLKNTAEKAQIDAMRKCASDSRFRKDPSDPSKPDKMFWNATGKTLSDDFKTIADELSNLRIVS